MTAAFVQDDALTEKPKWRKIAGRLRPKVPRLAAVTDEAEADVLAYMTFPRDRWQKIYSTNSLERLNGEIKRRTEAAGILHNEDAIAHSPSPSCSNRSTRLPRNGQAPRCRKRSRLCATMKLPGCPPRPPDRQGPRFRFCDRAPELHRATRRDPSRIRHFGCRAAKDPDRM